MTKRNIPYIHTLHLALTPRSREEPTLYAHYISYIDPTSFTVNESIFILSIVIIGGMGDLSGSFFAAAFMVLLPELLRFVGLSDSIAANMRQIIYGAVLIVVMMTGKNGLQFFLWNKGR